MAAFPQSFSPFAQSVRDVARNYEQPDPLTKVSTFIRNAYGEAERHRRSCGIEDELLRCLRAYNNEYDPEDRALLGDVDVYMGITSNKIRALKSWISDILSSSEDQPWTITPTPMPELPVEAKEAVRRRLQQEADQYGLNFDLQERAVELIAAAQRHVSEIAAEACRRMETTIVDKMEEGGWRLAFDAFVHDLAVYPCGILRGPVVKREPRLRWNSNMMETVNALTYKMVRVDPFKIYPSPNSICPNSGAYIIERMPMTPSDLMDCIDLPFFNEAAIRKVFVQFPSGFREMLTMDTVEDIYNRTRTDTVDAVDYRYEVLAYYGKVPGELLLCAGVTNVDPQRMYEAEVWVCADYVLRAILSPSPLGKRPFQVGSFEKIPGNFWGCSLAARIRDIQRIANSSARSLVRNMAFSSGPIGEYDQTRLINEERIDEITPFRLFAVEPDKYAQTPSPAIRFQIVPSVADQLLRVYEFFSQKADDTSGIPAYVMGAPGVAGAGRTLGGLSMLMGNAAKGVKQVISGVDKYVIEPVVTSFYNMEMLFGTDPSVKADAQVKARGSAGLLQRELSQTRAVEVLQMLTPYLQLGVVPPEGIKVVVRDMLKGLGYNADEIVEDPQRMQQLLASGAQPGQAAPGMPGNTPATPTAIAPPAPQFGPPPPTLDGRSAPANAAMAAGAPLPAA